MISKSLIIFIQVFILFLSINLIKGNKECLSHDDPHMKTFDDLYYDFHYTGDHFILYDDFKDTRVTAGYQKCGQHHHATCNCAVYIKKGTKLMFLDFCSVKSHFLPFSKLYGVSVEQNSVGLKAIREVPTCKIISPSHENDENTWNKIDTFLGKFKCARLQGSNHFDIYVVRTVANKFHNSVKVKFQVSSLNMPTLAIQASKSSYKNTGGLCGLWDDNRNTELFVLDKDGVEEFNVNLDTVSQFWKLHSRYNKDFKRCPECFLMSERSFYCPCDEFDLFDNSNYNIEHPGRETYCKVPMFSCIERYLNYTNIQTTTVTPVTSTSSITPETDVTTVESTDVTTVGTTTSPGITITPEEGFQICWEAFMTNSAISQAFENGCLDEVQFNLTIQFCALDVSTTGDLSFVNLHIELSIDLIIQNLINNQGNCSSIVTPELLCPNNCSNNGVCEFNEQCLSENNVNIDDSCLSPIKCNCNEPYGGIDCSEDLSIISDLSLDRDCCDLRTENCDRIIGYGYPFSSRNKIYTKIQLTEYNNGIPVVIEEYSTAIALSENQLFIKLNKLDELTLFKNIFNIPTDSVIDQSTALAKIYISYTNTSFAQAASFKLYDSKCRSCQDKETWQLQDTCEIDGKCYKQNETSSNSLFYCDPLVSNNTWTLKPTPDPLCNGNNEWTQWFNYDSPTGDGDLELFGIFDYGCTNPVLTQVQTIDGTPYDQTGQVVHFDSCYGFICLNLENPNNCLDYQIRQCCDKDSIITTSKPTTTSIVTETIEPSITTIEEEYEDINN